MALYIVNEEEKAPETAFEALVSLDGVVLINAGIDPDLRTTKEIEKIAVKFDWSESFVYFAVKQNDHFLALWSLSQIFADIWIRRSDIGKMYAHKLVKMGAARNID